MSLVEGRTPTGRTWTARPNHSLTVAERKCVFVVTAAGSGTIALVFSYFGAWPILPFTGVELALFWFALRYCELTAADYERIALDAGRLTIERRRGKYAEQYEFQSYWVHLQHAKSPGQGGSRLLLRSHGRVIELGRLLTEEQKSLLAAELKPCLGSASYKQEIHPI